MMISSLTGNNDSYEEAIARFETHKMVDDSYALDLIYRVEGEGYAVFMHDGKGRKMVFATSLHEPGSYSILQGHETIEVILSRKEERLISRKLWG